MQVDAFRGQEVISGSDCHHHCSAVSSPETAPAQPSARSVLGDSFSLGQTTKQAKLLLRGPVANYLKCTLQTCQRSPKSSTQRLQSSTQFSNKGSERWRSMSATNKWNIEDNSRQGYYEREMKIYIPQRGNKKEIQGSRCTRRPLSTSIFFWVSPKQSLRNTAANPSVILQRNQGDMEWQCCRWGAPHLSVWKKRRL
jgi:hypothetical protein